MAAAICGGLPITEPTGNMIVDIEEARPRSQSRTAGVA
jgi:hypothetical protein